MTRIRRSIAGLLAIALCLTMSVGAFAAAPEPQKEPKTGILYQKDDSDYSILRIHAPEDAPVYVKVIRYNPETGRNKKTPTYTLYLRAGKSLTVDMPSGEYTVRYATGSTWYGEEHLFGDGDDALYQQADSRLNFSRRGEGYEITLQVVKNGNLSSSRMKRENF